MRATRLEQPPRVHTGVLAPRVGVMQPHPGQAAALASRLWQFSAVSRSLDGACGLGSLPNHL